MRLFADVVRSGSFSESARRFGLSPSSVNRQIAGLEEHVGARLINRTTRRHRITEAGHLYCQHVMRILADVDAASEAVGGLESKPTGVLTVTAPMTFGRLHIAPALPAFLGAHLSLEVELSLTDRVVDLVDEAIDVAIRIDELEDSSLVARRLLPMERVVCASPAYLSEFGRPTEPGELKRHRCLAFQRRASVDRSHPGSKVWVFQKHGETLRVPVSGQLRSNSGDALVAAAKAAYGIALVPRWLIDQELRDGSLSVLLDEFHVSPDALDNAVHVVYPSTRFLSPKVRAFVDFLVDRFDRD